VNLLLRLLLVLLTAPFRARCDILGPARKRFGVWPPDLDVLLHVNNGVYLSMLDVARVDLLLRSGLLGRLRKRGFYPVVAAETIRFRRSLKLFQSFEVETKVLGWDDKAFILQHQFLRAGAVMAEAIIRSRYLKRGGGTVSTREVLEALGLPLASPDLPPWIDAWNRENAR
jgi:acyl-CoA thioesterase FadM